MRLGTPAIAIVASLVWVAPAAAMPNVTPETAAFPAQALGSQGAPITFTLQVTCNADPANPPNGCFGSDTYTTSIRTDSPDFVVVEEDCAPMITGATTPFGPTCQIRVAFAPKTLGQRTGILYTGSDPPDADHLFAVSALSGAGVAAPVQPSPPTKSKCKKRTKRPASAAKKKKKCKRKKRR